MWFFFMLFTILMWAGSDLFSKMGSRANDKNSHWKIVVAVGLVMGTHAIVQVASGVEFSPMTILTYLPVSAMYIISMLFGYMGLRYIELSISSPICNSSGAVTSLLCFLILNQPLEFDSILPRLSEYFQWLPNVLVRQEYLLMCHAQNQYQCDHL